MNTREKYGAISASQSEDTTETLAISVEGREGVGKSRFGLLTCPLPVIHVNIGDREATIFKYDMSKERQEGTQFYSFKAKGPEGWTRAEGMETLKALSEIAVDEMSDGKLAGGTFALDSGSSWWDVVQECYVTPLLEQGNKRRGGLEYMKGNLIVSGVFNYLRNQGANLVLTHRKNQAWGEKGPILGMYKAQINRKIPSLVEVRLDLRLVCPKCPAGGEDCEAKGHVGREHVARILKFGRNTSLIGMELAADKISYSYIYKLYYGRDYGEEERLV